MEHGVHGQVFSHSKSIQIWVIEISDRPGAAEAEPHFKYVANMHGNEPSGRVLLPQLAEWLCANHKTDQRAKRLVDDMHLHIMPTMNPDGFARQMRGNVRDVDLNRNFPDPIEVPNPAAMQQPLPAAQSETVAMMKWTLEVGFAASANLHEGAVVANYPFDGFIDHSHQVNGSRHPAPDDATFVYLAKLYAAKHKTMSKSVEFKDGIVNGAQWYPVYGGMQDWNYVAADCLSITLELSDNKWRPESDLQLLWQENIDALLALPLAAALGGVHGMVYSSNGTSLAAVVMVEGISKNITARQPFGFYSRPLAPGTYTLLAAYPGYKPAHATVTVPEDGSGVVQDFKLQPTSAIGSSQAGSSDSSEQFTLNAHGPLLIKSGRLKGNATATAIVGLLVCIAGALAVLYVCQGPRTMRQLYPRTSVVRFLRNPSPDHVSIT
eukprot:GHRR01012535.1.p1 GENE.GHRR01012535.1~~GHRR01012535.1.p1  ORF type:complete len:436 (+),score=143.34 GHRR01012535.1:2313-3620(+)